MPPNEEIQEQKILSPAGKVYSGELFSGGGQLFRQQLDIFIAVDGGKPQSFRVIPSRMTDLDHVCRAIKP